LPATVDLAADRIIQEALTNVLRHADACRVHLQLSYQPSQLHIRIRDDGTATSSDGAAMPLDQGGHGIEGMRERALALSGQLRAGPHAEGGFEVLATLPTPSHTEGGR
jgi:signal transduction histidine kinase